MSLISVRSISFPTLLVFQPLPNLLSVYSINSVFIIIGLIFIFKINIQIVLYFRFFAVDQDIFICKGNSRRFGAHMSHYCSLICPAIVQKMRFKLLASSCILEEAECRSLLRERG